MNAPSNPFGLPPELLAQIQEAMDTADAVLALSDEELIGPPSSADEVDQAQT